ncbi:acetyl-CoA carboxylase carboxyltransferase subunit alpha [Litorimonas taeanensis]|uniref:Acetyl-coenzyme A carboxylase carboxyl transferase subunit beta n=1 Tax=Litorimonas taeanensis TaxID=568099 RepID=A0A420WIT5_9PROT|nr:acetyl-CoA carboxylase, carboxyltransferase subunit beta [Litorimonas taeanensis]RKQ70835.1 acetyl-CoA carboxylase carboxyltransferase subunit alpha [Litorimonas taeanensis]
MNWLTKITPPGVKSIFSKKDTPDNLWTKCPKSNEMVFTADLPGLLHVTPAGHHMRIGPKLRMEYTFDEGNFETVAIPDVAKDPLKFKDDQKYVDRLKKARTKTGDDDAMSIGVGNIHGIRTVVLVQNFSFMGGSLGMAAGEGLITAAQYAVANKLPMVVFTAAGGARMQEGALSLMQMPRTTIAVQELRENGLPYIVVLCDPTTGGVTASYAMLGDIHLAEPGALICFAGPRVIEDTIREKLPEGFQRAEYLEEKGMIDRVVARKDMPKTLANLLSVLMQTPAKAPKSDNSDAAIETV